MKSLNERFGLQGRVALVTGASEGIGRDLALALAHAGADVIVSSRRETELKKVKAEIEATGRKSAFYVLDLCHIQAMASLRDFIRESFGRLDVLINGAGFAVTKPAWEVTEQDWNNMVDVGIAASDLFERLSPGYLIVPGFGGRMYFPNEYGFLTLLVRPKGEQLWSWSRFER